MAVYQTYVNAMNDKIRKQININNPFVFKHISNLKVRAHGGRAGRLAHREQPGERPGLHLASSSPSPSSPQQPSLLDGVRNLAAGVLSAPAPSPLPCHLSLLLNNSSLFVAEITSPDEKNILCIRFFCSYSNIIIFFYD